MIHRHGDKLKFEIDLRRFRDAMWHGDKFQVNIRELSRDPSAVQWAVERTLDDHMMASVDQATAEHIVMDTIRDLGSRIGMALLEEIVKRKVPPAPFPRYEPEPAGMIEAAIEKALEERSEGDDLLDFFMNRGKYER